MKFIHLLAVMGVAGAFGAAHAVPSRPSHSLTQRPSQAFASVVPPWLVEQPGTDDVVVNPHAVHEHDKAHEHDAAHEHAVDPHAGLDVGEDPHAGVYTGAEGAENEPDPDDDPYRRVGLEPTPEVPVAAIERSGAPNGNSVAELYAARQKLAGQTLRVRGTIVKLNEGILGKTYLHLRDGSGSADQGDDDLTVTTTDAFELGETVELQGELAIDQDVGAGYRYAALLTKATRVAP